ncbi:metal-binding protein [Marinilongibacter aquaticus]|uniref:Ada metal-binding domain-containing protein n=1 Tax=Marinilongibacter aquaticus TaxID=2975157 RepID=UPI0021BD8A8D|nr:Ada metal-binding domain-containing protein [Marinilongibacter aquaticus]UBM59509.1 metal-binding protein [Marinilongibacter aquaticus]
MPHTEAMLAHTDIENMMLWQKIRQGELLYAGNKKLKIYGTLRCSSGKRMKKENRVFFKNAAQAKAHGFRPCGHCMRQAYLHWKNESLQ